MTLCQQCRCTLFNAEKQFCSASCAITFRNSNGINNGHIKWCPGCSATRPVKDFFKNKARGDGLSALCWECHTQQLREFIQDLKNQIFIKYGDKCSECGFTDRRALQIGHSDGGGIKDRQGLGQVRYYRKVLCDETGKYRLQCANCNAIQKIVKREFRQSGRSKRIEVA